MPNVELEIVRPSDEFMGILCYNRVVTKEVKSQNARLERHSGTVLENAVWKCAQSNLPITNPQGVGDGALEAAFETTPERGPSKTCASRKV